MFLTRGGTAVQASYRKEMKLPRLHNVRSTHTPHTVVQDKFMKCRQQVCLLGVSILFLFHTGCVRRCIPAEVNSQTSPVAKNYVALICTVPAQIYFHGTQKMGNISSLLNLSLPSLGLASVIDSLMKDMCI